MKSAKFTLALLVISAPQTKFEYTSEISQRLNGRKVLGTLINHTKPTKKNGNFKQLNEKSKYLHQHQTYSALFYYILLLILDSPKANNVV